MILSLIRECGQTFLSILEEVLPQRYCFSNLIFPILFCVRQKTCYNHKEQSCCSYFQVMYEEGLIFYYVHNTRIHWVWKYDVVRTVVVSLLSDFLFFFFWKFSPCSRFKTPSYPLFLKCVNTISLFNLQQYLSTIMFHVRVTVGDS